MIASGTIAILTMIPGIAGGRPTRPPRFGGHVVHIHLVNRVGIPIRTLRSVERALIMQVGRDLDRFWPAGRVVFANRGWTITLERGATVAGGDGIHGVGKDGRPYARIPDSYDWTVSLSHELLELLTDPYLDQRLGGRPMEICDPVESITYRVRHVVVSDFVTPAWFLSPPPRRRYLAWIPG